MHSPGTPLLYHRRDTCRLCGSSDLTKILSFTPTPPANAFVVADRLNDPQPTFPLDLFFCRSCCHVQLLDVVDPAVLFENYVYVSGTSPSFVRHFEEYAAEVRTRFVSPSGSLVVDIGSNDGTLLGFFKSTGYRVLGIDPARRIARDATARGIETWPAFFNPDLARKIRAERGAAAIVTANNVFAHTDDLTGMVAGVRTLLTDDGVFVFEVSYLVDVYQKTLFDTIYHEHLAYHAVKPLVGFFRRNGMELIDVQRIDSHGGSLRGFAQRAGGPRRVAPAVAALATLEAELGLDSAETFQAFAARIETVRRELATLLHRLKAAGCRVVGFGAPAKATTLMHHFTIGPDIVDFIVDDSPLKQGLFSPGLHIPVLPPSAMRQRKPDYLLLLAWNFAEPIMAKHADFHAAGGRFIVPLPDLKVY